MPELINDLNEFIAFATTLKGAKRDNLGEGLVPITVRLSSV
jgi:hypothetical protein